MKKPSELLIWIAGLVYISVIPPDTFQFCFFKWIGFTFCPGCGIGHSIYYLVRGQWQTSWHCHPFALPALIILLYRIQQLIFFKLRQPSIL